MSGNAVNPKIELADVDIATSSQTAAVAAATSPVPEPSTETSAQAPLSVSSDTKDMQSSASEAKLPTATISTSMGNITVALYKNDAPKTVENFLTLAGQGFYDGTKFHRVIKGFMIQGGDPNSKDDTLVDRWGAGGPGYKFADEIDANSAIYKTGYKHGVLAMANSGPNTNGSQFFIMAADYPLPPLYTIFGEVVSGLDVVDAIDAVPTDGSAQRGGNDRPLTPVVVKAVMVGQ
jgi:cyclophilin family peptidyl-prolyl cis-trans isomerase